MTDTAWLEHSVRGWGPVDSQPMFGMQAYLVGGKMFAALGDQGVLVKLPASARQPLLDEGRAQTMVTGTGAVFGEWVMLPPTTLQEDQEWILGLVRQSFDYVRSAVRPQKPAREQRRFRKRQF